MVSVGLAPRLDSAGKQICELCPVRLSRAKGKLHVHGPGHICTRCYNLRRDSAAASATTPLPTAAKRSRKRRAQSHPGERTSSRRVTPPQPAPGRLRVRAIKAVVRGQKKQNQEKEAAITALLDAAHARRVAAMALEQLGAAGVLSSSSSSAAAASSSSSSHPNMK